MPQDVSDRTLIGFYGDDELKDRLQKRAVLEDRSMSSLLRRICERYLTEASANDPDGFGMRQNVELTPIERLATR